MGMFVMLLAASAAPTLGGPWTLSTTTDPFTDVVTRTAAAKGRRGNFTILFQCTGGRANFVVVSERQSFGGRYLPRINQKIVSLDVRTDGRQPLHIDGRAIQNMMVIPDVDDGYSGETFPLLLSEFRTARVSILIRSSALNDTGIDDQISVVGGRAAIESTLAACSAD